TRRTTTKSRRRTRRRRRSRRGRPSRADYEGGRWRSRTALGRRRAASLLGARGDRGHSVAQEIREQEDVVLCRVVAHDVAFVIRLLVVERLVDDRIEVDLPERSHLLVIPGGIDLAQEGRDLVRVQVPVIGDRSDRGLVPRLVRVEDLGRE